MIKSLRGMKACDVVVQSATKRIRRVTVQASSKPDKCVTSRRLILPGLSILIVPQVLATTLDARAATDAGDWSSPGLASRDDDSPKWVGEFPCPWLPPFTETSRLTYLFIVEWCADLLGPVMVSLTK